MSTPLLTDLQQQQQQDPHSTLPPSPRTGAGPAPVSHERAVPMSTYHPSPLSSSRLLLVHWGRSLSSSSAAFTLSSNLSPPLSMRDPIYSSSRSVSGTSKGSPPLLSSFPLRHLRRTTPLSRSLNMGSSVCSAPPKLNQSVLDETPCSPRSHKKLASLSEAAALAQTKSALSLNDSMVYLDGPQVYACQQCRTHLTSHDDIISKSFHGRHGRAFLLDQAVNVRIGPAEDRVLMTGLHAVCDIFCKRCSTLIGWTYQKAYEGSQKYKEGKFIIEKINLYLEESDYYKALPPAGERRDRWRQRSIRWGEERGEEEKEHRGHADQATTGMDPAFMVYEYPTLE